MFLQGNWKSFPIITAYSLTMGNVLQIHEYGKIHYIPLPLYVTDTPRYTHNIAILCFNKTKRNSSVTCVTRESLYMHNSIVILTLSKYSMYGCWLGAMNSRSRRLKNWTPNVATTPIYNVSPDNSAMGICPKRNGWYKNRPK